MTNRDCGSHVVSSGICQELPRTTGKHPTPHQDLCSIKTHLHWGRFSTQGNFSSRLSLRIYTFEILQSVCKDLNSSFNIYYPLGPWGSHLATNLSNKIFILEVEMVSPSPSTALRRQGDHACKATV